LYGCGLYIRHSFLLRKESLNSDLRTYSSDFLFVDYLCWPKYEIPCSLRCGTAAACLLGLWVRILLGTWFSLVSVVCCQVEVSVSGCSLIWRSPSEYNVSSTCPRVSAAGKKCKIYNFQFLLLLLVFLVHLMLSCNCFFFLHLLFFYSSPLGNNRWKFHCICTFTGCGYFS